MPAKRAAEVRAATPAKRLNGEDRENDIVQRAIGFFASHGFEASTRELAKELGVTQPLLYRYFPNKDSLVERVYEEVFMRRWNPEWEEWLADRTIPLKDRMSRYLKDYARHVLRSDYVRIFMYAALNQKGDYKKVLARLHTRHFRVIVMELRHERGLPAADEAQMEEDVDLVWAMHSSVFYIGVRKWIYGWPVPKDVDRVIDLRVEAFFSGVPAVLAARR